MYSLRKEIYRVNFEISSTQNIYKLSSFFGGRGDFFLPLKYSLSWIGLFLDSPALFRMCLEQQNESTDLCVLSWLHFAGIFQLKVITLHVVLELVFKVALYIIQIKYELQR